MAHRTLTSITRLFAAWLCVATFCLPAVAAEAEKQAIRDIFDQNRPLEQMFTSAFLAAIPASQLTGLLDDLSADIGPVQDILGQDGSFRVLTSTHELAVRITLDGDGRIAGLFFDPPVPLDLSLDAALAALNNFGNERAFLVRQDGTTLAAHAPDAPLAVGSAFKLGVLAALRDQIGTGLAWDDVIRLAPHHRSLPSGRIHLFPDAAPFTLHTLAAAMIGESDNTATDMLMDHLGRDVVAARLGVDHLLTTREFFILKADKHLRAAFLEGTPQDRATLTDTLSIRRLPKLGEILHPHDKGIEWYLPVNRLCDLIGAVADLDLMQINPGVSRPRAGEKVAFKGGSEIGVINLTTHITAPDGTGTCIALTINGPDPLPETDITTTYARIIAALRQRHQQQR